VDVVSVRLQLGYGHMLQRNRQEFVAFNVSNEALEAAAGTAREKAANYTLAACSGLSVCPA
jgi:hypothetical protein